MGECKNTSKQQEEKKVKHGVKPTRSQRLFLKSKRLNSENWLVVKDTPTEMVLVHKHFDNKTRVIQKVGNTNE